MSIHIPIFREINTDSDRISTGSRDEDPLHRIGRIAFDAGATTRPSGQRKCRIRFACTWRERSINGGYRQDGKGVVFLLNVTSVEEAHELFESLALGQAKLMKFDQLPLEPLAPLLLHDVPATA